MLSARTKRSWERKAQQVSRHNDSSPPSSQMEIKIGTIISKEFSPGEWFYGQVASWPPETVVDENGNKLPQKECKVVYEDEDEETLPTSVIQALITPQQKPYNGMKIFKRRKTSPIAMKTVGKVKDGPYYKIVYDDDDNNTEFLKEEVIQQCALKVPFDEKANGTSDEEEKAKPHPDLKLKATERSSCPGAHKCKQTLEWTMGISKEEIERVWQFMKAPYDINTAIQMIHFAKDKPENEELLTEDVQFHPQIGTALRKNVHGCTYYGRITRGPYRGSHPVTGKTTELWDTIYSYTEEDDCEEFGIDWQELLECRASRPMQSPKIFGRPLYFLEIFSGCGIMTQKFQERKWIVKSIDKSPSSNAVHKVDIMDIDFDQHIGMLPDFVVFAPDCSTYSNLSGGIHRKPLQEEYAVSTKALEHDDYLARTWFLIKWFLYRKPHMIFLIENPRASLRNMPLMKYKLEKGDGLPFGQRAYRAEVNYCAFGRDDMKPTDLWTNDIGLHNRLNKFKCRCPGRHATGARGNTKRMNVAKFPEKLAELVSEYAHSKFVMEEVHDLNEPTVTEQDKIEFTKGIKGTN
ncbi:hypothetical protein IV203_013683 [Nitzschia inconspicua]|uniref:Uncharacterized protein n=1 Tax=Nitzschia inconspicua TaxID=303405 RepID=A0A9K3M5K8_9STRA|nr:hypothetical protein IV203_013683 [Nitzschia inconspicua]